MGHLDVALAQFQAASSNRLTLEAARALLDSLVAEFEATRSTFLPVQSVLKQMCTVIDELVPGLCWDAMAEIALMAMDYAEDARFWSPTSAHTLSI